MYMGLYQNGVNLCYVFLMKGTLLTFIIHCGFRSSQGIACSSYGHYYCEGEQPQIFPYTLIFDLKFVYSLLLHVYLLFRSTYFPLQCSPAFEKQFQFVFLSPFLSGYWIQRVNIYSWGITSESDFKHTCGVHRLGKA